MLSRIGGGNSGIVYYLETGQKQGRELGRDDLDYRLCLDGNIEHLDHVINSIPDKGQERYLHISLSFYENNINEEMLKSVCEEYKTLLMNAYDTDEYCFYAEAHIPKVKNIVDEKTGKLIERKPHIHIVIPEKNLVTGNKLNPTGMVEHYVKNIDAIQEHINNKFNLASPKDGIRVSDQNHANVLSRMKGDLFNEAKYDFKQDLVNQLEKKNIKTEEAFLNHLVQFGEVKIYNKNNHNRYYGVKLQGESKFTRLKSPLFSKQFIETRTIPLIKPTPKEIERNLDEWCSKISHEIKHVHPAGEKLRKTYAKLNDTEKAEMLLTLRKQYNERNNLKPEPREHTELSGQLRSNGNQKRSINNYPQRTQSRSAQERLPSLQERNMVYELRGFGQRKTNQSNPVLSPNERRFTENTQQGRQYYRGGMRWTPDNRERGRITNSIQQALIKFENKPTDIDLKLMREIRVTIDPERFLSYCASKYNINPEEHKISFAKDNSPRFNTGKLNLNASDFLTKHLGLDWQDAKNDLLSINESQQKNEPYLSVLSHTPLNMEQAKERAKSRNNSKIALNCFYREQKQQLDTEYKQGLKELKFIKNNKIKEVERGFLMFSHLKDTDNLNIIMNDKRQVVNAIHNHWKPNDKHQQEILNMVLGFKKNQKINMITNADSDFSFEKLVSRKKVFNDFQDEIKTGTKLTDLVANKKDKEIQYLNQKTKEVVFKDKGTHVELKDSITKHEAGMAMEYAEKKYGGKLRLSGSETFKQTCAIAAAEKGLNVILSPDKYHEMMLKHIEKLQQKDTPQQVEQSDKQQTQNSIEKSPNYIEKNINNDQKQLNENELQQSHIPKEEQSEIKKPIDEKMGASIENKEPIIEQPMKNDFELRAEKDFKLFQNNKITAYEIMLKSEFNSEYAKDLNKTVGNNELMKTIEIMAKYSPMPDVAKADIIEKVKEQGFNISKETGKDRPFITVEGMAEKDFKEYQDRKITAFEMILKSESSPEYAKGLNKVINNNELRNSLDVMAKYSPMPESAKADIIESVKQQGFKLTQETEQREQNKQEFKVQPTIDEKAFNKLIVVPVKQSDGFEETTSYKVAFKQDDKMVLQLKDLKESDLNRMGINTQHIDMRKTEPVNVNLTDIKHTKIDSPLKHAEKTLDAHVSSMKGREMTRVELDALKSERAKLEDNVQTAKEQHNTQPTPERKNQTKEQEQSKGETLH